MNRLQIGCLALTALVVANACGENPTSQPGDDTALAAGGRPSPDLDADHAHSQNGFIAVLDECDPDDPNWAPIGGCLLKTGTVTVAEFNAERLSPLSSAVIGHQAWRNEPSYMIMHSSGRTRARNEGGRAHTFTRVANFGGGRVAPLSVGLLPAPECQAGAGAIDLAPGAVQEIAGLSPGTHRFQCCIHPWMRALIVVEADHMGHGAL